MSERFRVQVDEDTQRWVAIGSDLLRISRPLYVKSSVAVFFRDTTPDAIKRNKEFLQTVSESIPSPEEIKKLERQLGIEFPEDPNIEE